VWADLSGEQPEFHPGKGIGINNLDIHRSTLSICTLNIQSRAIVLAFLGIDGAGKTTIVKALQGGLVE
jgi:ABC-type uncharacterized transport system ATPase subunit